MKLIRPMILAIFVLFLVFHFRCIYVVLFFGPKKTRALRCGPYFQPTFELEHVLSAQSYYLALTHKA